MMSDFDPLVTSPIRFGTDGWRGILGVDFTLERLLPAAAAAAQELAFQAPPELVSREVLIGFDRRFMAKEFAQAIASAVRGCGLEPLLSETSLTTPACSWAVVSRKALGALVITASHNPPEWLGLKIKGSFGGSVEGGFTQAVELRLAAGGITAPISSGNQYFDGRKEHLDGLSRKFDLPGLARGLSEMGMKLIVDPMHGCAAGCFAELLGSHANGLVHEIRGNRDPLFGGHSPEPLASNLSELIDAVKASGLAGKPALGLVFDGDGDRLAAVDEKGRFCSTQLLMPLLIHHLAKKRNLPGCVVKTVSGSDLMHLVAQDVGREVIEMPVGFKYITSEMLSREVLVGGEESGGIGFGSHLPERDALFAALLVLEALKDGGKTLGEMLDDLQCRFGGATNYQRIDLRLANLDHRNRLEVLLQDTPPSKVAGKSVQEVVLTDGVKLRLGPSYWLMMRFSGTEPLLRLYCEAPSEDQSTAALKWAQELAESA